MADPVKIILRESIIVESHEEIKAGGSHVTSLDKWKRGY
jgi:hypothetical protein